MADAADGVAAAVALLREQTEAVLSSDGFAAYLRMLGTFHRYSWSNVLLIMAQRPDATLVNSYRRWQQLGRRVRKGERGIRIFYPRRRRTEQPETEPDPAEEPERVVTGFGVASVFDVAQTEGDPLPDPPSVAESTDSSAVAAAVNTRAALWLVGQGLRLESRPLRSSANGWYDPGREPKEIVIKQADPALGVDPLNVARTRTLLHEMAHFVADHKDGVPRDDAETVAEAAAYAVLARWGIDPGKYSPYYVARWARDREVLRRNLGEVGRVARAMIGAIEGEEPGEAEEWL